MRFLPSASPAVLAAVAVFALAPAAEAQKKTDAKPKAEEKAKAEEPSKTEPKAEEKSEGTKAAGTEDKAEADDEKDEATPAKPPPPPADPSDAKEEPGKTYYYIGARWRQTLLPKFMLGLFVAGGPKQVWIPSFGLEGTMRKDGFDTTLYLTYADWGMDPFAFKGKDEANTAWEIVESRLKLVNLGVDLLWGNDFNKNFSFQYGITTGIALVFGDLKRVQGKPRDGAANPDNPDDIVPCASAGNVAAPTEPRSYCGNDNNHYGDYKEPSWFNGGKKPNLYASFGPQLGFRWKPVKQFMARVNFGWDLFQGPFFGLNGSYGL